MHNQSTNPNTEIFNTASPEETIALGKDFASKLTRGDCVSLRGDLGAGKTVLVRGIAAGAGLEDTKMVSSPTYVLVHEYPAPTTLYHLDLYRMGNASAELDDLGFDEMLADGIVLIEWANRAENALPPKRWDIQIEHISDHERKFTISKLG